MKQLTSQKVKKAKIQSLKHKTPKPGANAELDNQWSYLEDEEDLVVFQHAYEFDPEHRFFN